MLVRVRDFGESHAARFPESTLAKPLFAKVASAVTELQANDMTRESTARGGGTNTRDGAREALLQWIEAVFVTARAVALDTAGLEDKFRRLAPKPKDQQVLTTARVYAKDAELFETAFVAHGLAKTFPADFAGAIDCFDRALRDHDMGKDYNAASRASSEAAFEAGAAAVQKLNAIVINQLRDDPAAMARWYRDRRVKYPRGRSLDGPSLQAAAVTPPSPVTPPQPPVDAPPVETPPQPAPAVGPLPQPIAPAEAGELAVAS